jgi:hypothetical protein
MKRVEYVSWQSFPYSVSPNAVIVDLHPTVEFRREKQAATAPVIATFRDKCPICPCIAPYPSSGSSPLKAHHSHNQASTEHAHRECQHSYNTHQSIHFVLGDAELEFKILRKKNMKTLEELLLRLDTSGHQTGLKSSHIDDAACHCPTVDWTTKYGGDGLGEVPGHGANSIRHICLKRNLQ